jgi:hypothetical protein
VTLLAEAPALPLHKAGPYVAAAYIVFVAVILIYVTIMAVRLSRNERELIKLRRELSARGLEDNGGDGYGASSGEPAEPVGRR